MDKKLWDAWLDFSSDAMKGAEQARKTFEDMAAAPFGQDDLSKWMSQWYPKGAASPDELTEVVEAWWCTSSEQMGLFSTKVQRHFPGLTGF